MEIEQKENIFKTIIVGIDFSSFSKTVVKQAQKIASQMNAKLILVHAASTDWATAASGIYIPPISSEELIKDVENFYRLKASPQLSIVARKGSPEDLILKTAKKSPSPLIVVGSQGKSAISRYLLGSHAEQVALKANCPVWVHRGRRLVDFKKILIPTDLSGKSLHHIHRLQEWQKRYPLSLDFLYVKPEVPPIMNYEIYRKMSKEMNVLAKKAIARFREKEPSVSIKTVIGNDPSRKISSAGKNYDVIAMNPHSHSAIFHKFGPITSKVIRLSDNPVLVMKT